MFVTSLHHYSLDVPDLGVAEGFLQDFGLETTEKDGALLAACAGRAQEQIRLNEGPHKRLHHLAFTVRAGGLDAAPEALDRARLAEIEPPPGGGEGGLWLRDPDGTPVQLIERPPAPPRPVAEVLSNIGASRQRVDQALWQQVSRDVKPHRLGHALVFTPQMSVMVDFYTRVLGLGLSDTIPGKVTFLNAGPGDHHVFGFIASSHPGLHHASFEVPSIDAIALGADRMRVAGRPTGWGLGRHTIGSNFFHYNPDPWGSWLEWFSDIDQIDHSWIAREWEAPPHLWAPPPPETFLANLEPPRGTP